MKRITLVLLMVLSVSCFAQNTKQDSLWKPFKFLQGKWQGKGGGEPGQGSYERSYKFIFNGKFIEVDNKTVYPPSKDNPKGEVHQDKGYISYDKARKTFVLRQFHSEGFVNQYVLESMSPDGRNISFLSEAIENIPAGWKARETYQVKSDREFTEIFELAPPQKDFDIYTKAVLKKVK